MWIRSRTSFKRMKKKPSKFENKRRETNSSSNWIEQPGWAGLIRMGHQSPYLYVKYGRICLFPIRTSREAHNTNELNGALDRLTKCICEFHDDITLSTPLAAFLLLLLDHNRKCKQIGHPLKSSSFTMAALYWKWSPNNMMLKNVCRGREWAERESTKDNTAYTAPT